MELGRHRRPVLLIEVGDDLGVAISAEAMTALPQPCPEFLEVVDLAVEDDRNRSVLVEDGLIARFQVDDAEPLDAQSDPSVTMKPSRVRTAMGQSRAHTHDQILADRSAVVSCLSADAAHELSTSASQAPLRGKDQTHVRKPARGSNRPLRPPMGMLWRHHEVFRTHALVAWPRVLRPSRSELLVFSQPGCLAPSTSHRLLPPRSGGRFRPR